VLLGRAQIKKVFLCQAIQFIAAENVVEKSLQITVPSNRNAITVLATKGV